MNERKFTPEEIAKSLIREAYGDKEEGVNLIASDMLREQAKRIEELEGQLILRQNELLRLREENRWIPTSERKPDRELEAEPNGADGKPLLGGYECIAMIEGAKRPTALWYCHIDGEGVWLDDSAENCYPVTHWKPMPKGPEG